MLTEFKHYLTSAPQDCRCCSECGTATGTLPIYIALIRNFIVLMNKTGTASSKLNQEGNYTCVATSKYGTDVNHFVIKGSEKIRYFETNTMHTKLRLAI